MTEFSVWDELALKLLSSQKAHTVVTFKDYNYVLHMRGFTYDYDNLNAWYYNLDG